VHIVLNTHGASIKKENGLFLISTAEGAQRISPKDIKTISISASARISSDAVLLAIKHQIDVLFVDFTGIPQGRIWSVQYGSISTIRHNQMKFVHHKDGVIWVKELLNDKLNNCIALLMGFLDQKDLRLERKIKSCIHFIEAVIVKINLVNANHISEVASRLRGLEGVVARKYFQLISEMLPQEYKFEKRSTYPALDPFNASLNYAYGILYARVESALIKSGIDPYVGVFHRDDYNRPALVFDVIEKYRVWADFVTIRLIIDKAFHSDSFISANGKMIIDGLAKRILIQSMNDYLNEIIVLNKLERSRGFHIELQAQNLAQKLLNSKYDF
jgi:CRISPR-associated protein Cas1